MADAWYPGTGDDTAETGVRASVLAVTERSGMNERARVGIAERNHLDRVV
jgi:hypothetical protein